MSFEPPTDLDFNDNNKNSSTRTNGFPFRPLAPPPATPPPPPPPGGGGYGSINPSIINKNTNPFLPNVVNYFEDHGDLSPASRNAKRKAIIPEYDNVSHQASSSSSSSSSLLQQSSQPQEIPSFASVKGDATLRPNIGESNAAIGEESLHESLYKMRMINLLACVMGILLEVPNILGHVFLLQPARAVLGGYLSFFSVLLGAYELDMWGADFIRHYFGLLHHPLGRSFVLFLMGGLAIGQRGILDILLGIVFVLSSGYTTLTFIWYPEYRRRIASEAERESLIQQTMKHHSWTAPDAAALGDAVSLLHKSVSV